MVYIMTQCVLATHFLIVTFILEYFHCHHIETIVDVTMVIKSHACFYLWLLCSARNTKVRLWSLCKNHDNV